MVDPKLLDCFKPIPLPERKEGQTYQPLNRSWYELHFLYRVEIRGSVHVSRDARFDSFFRVKEEMQSDPARWGIYREDWFAHVSKGVNFFYFMERDRALMFRLWVDL